VKVYYKDKQALNLLIVKKGYTQSNLSKKIGKCRQYINKSLQTDVIGPNAARKVAEFLEEPYENLFEIR
jgi:DNA-binding XRE family transcriptional regulator